MSARVYWRRCKAALRQWQRRQQDRRSGLARQFCTAGNGQLDFPYSLSFRQDIKPSATLANKVHNLATAAGRIRPYVLLPGQVFSFWHCVGSPERGFQDSRSIINGQTVNERGGGICQVSGLVYFAAISVGLEILERHHHSVDLYTEETRFAPLGSDATVVYGYKDLRMRNNLPMALKFDVRVEDEGRSLVLTVWGTAPLVQQALHFELQQQARYKEVWVHYADGTTVNRSRYRYPDDTV